MNVYYFDNSTPTRQWTEMLANAKAVQLQNNRFILRDPPQTSITSGVIFVHRTYIGDDWSGLLSALEAEQTIISVVVSGAAQVGDVASSHPRLYFRQSIVATPVDSNFKRSATRFIEYLDANGIGLVDFNLLEPDGDEALALKLLCEAYSLPPIRFGIKSYTAQAVGVAVIPVHCPDPDTWFDLIGASKPANDQDEAAITAFGRLMGDAGKEAMDLARAIARGDSDISGPAGKFVEKVSEITAAQEKGTQ
ncbi:MAG TPA: hypothetical protein PLU30_00310 [Verrucomicrobiae bacterium]|nr:hypothetical protein [Verrucomicrobiae bacterium]